MDSWLYLRRTDSVRLVELTPLTLVVCGPGTHRTTMTFDDPGQLFAYRQQSANALTAAGYELEGFRAERRLRDRRSATRVTADRRRS